MDDMSEQSALIALQKTSRAVARVTFNNPPVNLVVGGTVRRLSEILDELDSDPHVQVVVFDSAVPDFFVNHFDIAGFSDFPTTAEPDGVPPWTDIVLRLTKAPYITVGLIRGRTRGGGNEFALALDLRYASLEKAFFGQPEVGGGLVPGGGGTERLPRTIGRDRALEVILSSADYDGATAERWGWVTRALPDDELDAYEDRTVARLASFDRTALANAKAMVNRAVLPPDADVVTAYGEFTHTLTLPGFLSRTAGNAYQDPETALKVEYDLGAFIGAGNLRRAQAIEGSERSF
jgi:enoyl-CoA hydratase/carnithine racemase